MRLPEDHYPSRTTPEPQWLTRADPVVYGDINRSAGPLSRAQLEAYERDGYLFFPELIAAHEVASLREEMRRLSRDSVVLAQERVVTEPYSGDLRTLFEIHKISEVFAELAADHRLAGIAEQLLGDDVYITQSRLNYKPGFHAKEFHWHSDFETWHVEDGMPRMRAFSISIALTENDALNGPLMVIPGSHRRFVSCVGETPEDNYRTSLKRQVYGVPDDDSLARLVEQGGIFAATGKIGSAIMFDCNLMHGSNSNITPFPRSNAFFAYNAVSNALTEPFGQTRRRPEFLAERHPEPLRQARRVA